MAVDMEAAAERTNAIAVAQIQATAVPKIAANHVQSILGEATAHANLIYGEGAINASATGQIADIESQSILLTGNAQAQATIFESLNAAGAVITVSNYQVILTQQDAAHEVSAINASADAQAKSTSGESAAHVATLSALATINSGESASTAAIRSNAISSTAQAQASGSLAEANVRASGAASVAATRVTLIQGEAANAVSNIQDQAAVDASEATTIAGIRAQADQQRSVADVATIQGESNAQVSASAGVSGAQAREIQQATAARASQVTTDAALLALETTSTAVIDAETSGYVADSRYASETHEADQGYAADRFAADQSYTGSTYQASQGLAADRYSADRNLQSTKYTSLNDLTGRVSAANTHAAADKHSADQSYAGIVAHENGEDYRLAETIAVADFRFGQIWPLVTTPVTLPTGAIVTTPGFSTNTPKVSFRGVYSPAQVQAQANAVYASTSTSVASSFLKTRNDIAGRGFSAATPYVAASLMADATRGLRESTSKAAGVRVQSASDNATRWLEAQSNRNDLFMGQQRAYLGAEANAVRRQVGLIEGVFRIVGELL